jgi:undecaprenyl-diphosphatase
MTERQSLVLLLVTVGLLAVLTVLVWNGDTEGLDQTLRSAALDLNSPASVMIWEDISLMGTVAVITTLSFVGLAVFAILKQWRAVRALAMAMIGAMVFDNSMKWLIHRPRAAEVYAGTMPMTFSYPSGHALFSFVFYLTMAALISRQSQKVRTTAIWGAAILLVALIGASRIFLGVHYGSDVLGGYLISAIWMMVLARIQSQDRA